MGRERIEELEFEIKYHSAQYYNGVPAITDAEFDDLVDELKVLDATNPALQEVGAFPTYGRKVRHPSVMGSLNKINEIEDLQQWVDLYRVNSEIVTTPKIDGLAVRLRYQKGILVEAATRGDGIIGQDILANAKEVAAIPQILPRDFDGEVRGEVYMRRSVCKRLGCFANPRNGAAGALLNSDPNQTRQCQLDFMCYYMEEDGKKPVISEALMLIAAQELGFEVVELESVDPVHLEGHLLYWETNRRPKLDFCIDGMVVSLNRFGEQQEAGWHNNRPHGKQAWKFKPVQREAVVSGCDWQVGRTGKLTPVLHIEPTEVDGSTIRNISLHSLDLFTQLNLCEGDKVLIEKAGDIIPQVVRVTRRSGAIQLQAPLVCPSCSHRTVEEGANMWCSNITCSAQLERRVLFWLKTVNVLGAGPGVVKTLCDAKAVECLSDLYHLNEYEISQVLGSTAIGTKLAKELAVKSVMPLSTFLDGLGISGLGTTASKAVSKAFGTLDKVMEAEATDFAQIEGIGLQTARKIECEIQALRSSGELEALALPLEIEELVQGGALDELSFCLTGTMSRGRKEIAADIEAAGGTVKSSVGKGLTYLVQADKQSVSSKTKKAEKFGVKIISEVELNEMIGLGGMK
jgi:DNA ligase (NAD+)